MSPKGAGAVLYSTALRHLHHTLRIYSPHEEVKTYLKPLISAGEVQNCLQRTWCQIHLIWKTITEGDGDRYTKYWQANANHWSITRLKGSQIRRRLNCLLRQGQASLIFTPSHEAPESGTQHISETLRRTCRTTKTSVLVLSQTTSCCCWLFKLCVCWWYFNL